MSITVEKEYSSLPLVDCYAGQLNQVFMNLLINAIDTLESKHLKESRHSGNSTKTAAHLAANLKNESECSSDAQTTCTLPRITICTEAPDPNQVIIRIGDNGSGIAETDLSKIFDPFFTTKPVGKGTGLGLSISYQIVVERHGGQLSCVSTVGQGTEFTIVLPVHPVSKHFLANG